MRHLGRRLAPIVPWLLFAVVVVAWVLALVFDPRSAEVTTALDRLWAVSFLAFPMVGLILALRIPDNLVGWLSLVGPALVGVGVALTEYGEATGRSSPWLPARFAELGAVALLAAVLVFPDGRYPNRGFRWAHVAVLTAYVAGLAIGVDSGSLVLPVSIVLSLAALVYRWVRGGAVLRRQITGPVLVLVLGMLIFAFMAVLELWVGPLGPQAGTLLGTVATITWTVGLPVSIAVAITRFRLYEMDRIVSRTVSYVVVVVLLGTVYLVGVGAMSTFLPAESPLAVAGSTLAVAALFNPVRKRVQTGVDRRFNRSRFDAAQVMDRFSGSLQDRVATEEIVNGWVDVVATTMQPGSIGVWTRESV